MRFGIAAFIGVVVIGAGAIAQQAAPKPQPHSRMNCHIAYDYVQKLKAEQPGAVGSDATGWAFQHSIRAQEGVACIEPPIALARRAAGHVIETRPGMQAALQFVEKQDDIVAAYEMTLPMRAGLLGNDLDWRAGEIIGTASGLGYPPAMYEAGVIWLTRQPVDKRRPAEGAALIRRAAEAGLREAQFQYAVLNQQGTGVPRDAAAAYGWYRKAAEQGHLDAVLSAAGMLGEGEGVRKDTQEALRLTRTAANQGSARAMAMMAAVLLMSDKPDKVEDEVWYWLNRASSAGDPAIRQLVEGQRAKLRGLFNRPPPARPRYTPPAQQCPWMDSCITYTNTKTGAVSKSCVGGVNYWHCK